MINNVLPPFYGSQCTIKISLCDSQLFHFHVPTLGKLFTRASINKHSITS